MTPSRPRSEGSCGTPSSIFVRGEADSLTDLENTLRHLNIEPLVVVPLPCRQFELFFEADGYQIYNRQEFWGIQREDKESWARDPTRRWPTGQNPRESNCPYAYTKGLWQDFGERPAL